MGGNNKRVKVVSPLPFDTDGGGEKKRFFLLLSRISNRSKISSDATGAKTRCVSTTSKVHHQSRFTAGTRSVAIAG
jgi:hypothetical protein